MWLGCQWSYHSEFYTCHICTAAQNFVSIISYEFGWKQNKICITFELYCDPWKPCCKNATQDAVTKHLLIVPSSVCCLEVGFCILMAHSLTCNQVYATQLKIMSLSSMVLTWKGEEQDLVLREEGFQLHVFLYVGTICNACDICHHHSRIVMATHPIPPHTQYVMTWILWFAHVLNGPP